MPCIPLAPTGVAPRLGCKGICAHLQQFTRFGLILLNRFLNKLGLNMLQIRRVFTVQDCMLGFYIFFNPLGYETCNLSS